MIELKDKSGGTIVLNKDGIELKKGGMSLKITDSKITFNGNSLEVM